MLCSSHVLKRWLYYTFLAVFTSLLCIVPISSFALTVTPSTSISDSTSIANAAQQFDRQGQLLYQTRQWQEAANQFQQAIEGYAFQGDWLRQALSLGNLALTYQQLGQWQAANQTIAESMQLFELHRTDASESTREAKQVQAQAQILDIQGNLHLTQGQPDAAINSWQQSLQLYEQLERSDSIEQRIIENQINQAQALQNLGLYRRAINLLYQVSGLEQVAFTTQRGQPETLFNLSPEELQTQLQTLPHLPTTTIALQSLGEALRITGNLDQAQVVLQHVFGLAEELNRPELMAAIQIQLANLEYAQAVAELNRNNLTLAEAIEFVHNFQQRGDRFGATDLALQFYRKTEAILERYQQAIEIATPAPIQNRARLNQFSILIETGRQSEAQALVPLIQQQFQSLPLTHTILYAQINFAHGLMQLQKQQENSVRSEVIEQLLLNVIEQAKQLSDQQAESYALGSLAKDYEQQKQYDKAETLTRRALLIAQSIQSSEIAYVWQWQLGRLLKMKKEYPGAIAAYQEAVLTLNTIRRDLVAVSPETQYSFRDTIEPIHRELVALLLSNPTSITAADLESVRSTIESLQLSELVNFFREDCLNTDPISIDQVDTQAVIFYPIILPDQLAVIVSLPNEVSQNIPVNVNSDSTSLRCDTTSTSSQETSRSFCYYSTAISGLEIEETVKHLRNALEQPNDPDFLWPAQILYNWLIRPIAPALAQLQNTNPHSDQTPATLVFVLDGGLRNIPMSVLHDGEHFLVERYNLALAPGLQLIESRPLQQSRLRALIGGLHQARQGFSELSYVIPEVKQIETTLADRQVLLDQAFTESEFEAAIRSVPFPVVHLATHGQFSSQLDKTFILTWDDRLTINQLRSLLQATELRQNSPLELLVLSACETAAGDDRATLGLAGMAVRSGARSTIATLWQINDASSAALMGRFYQELTRQDNTKAEALRQAQLALLHDPNYQRPYYWAPYILVGNWQ